MALWGLDGELGVDILQFYSSRDVARCLGSAGKPHLPEWLGNAGEMG